MASELLNNVSKAFRKSDENTMASKMTQKELDERIETTSSAIEIARSQVQQVLMQLTEYSTSEYANEKQIQSALNDAVIVEKILKRLANKASNLFYPPDKDVLVLDKKELPMPSTSVTPHSVLSKAQSSFVNTLRKDAAQAKAEKENIIEIELDEDGTEVDVTPIVDVTPPSHPIFNTIVLTEVLSNLTSRELLASRFVCHKFNEECVRVLSVARDASWISANHYEGVSKYERKLGIFRKDFDDSFSDPQYLYRNISVNSTLLATCGFQEILCQHGKHVKRLKVTHLKIPSPLSYDKYPIAECPTITLFPILSDWCPNLEKLHLDCLREGMFYQKTLHKSIEFSEKLLPEYEFATPLCLKTIVIEQPHIDITCGTNRNETFPEHFKPPIFQFIEKVIVASSTLKTLKLPKSTVFLKCCETFPLLPLASRNLKWLKPSTAHNSSTPHPQHNTNLLKQLCPRGSEIPVTFPYLSHISLQKCDSSQFLSSQFEDFIKHFSNSLKVLHLDQIGDMNPVKASNLLYVIKLVPNLRKFRLSNNYNDSGNSSPAASRPGTLFAKDFNTGKHIPDYQKPHNMLSSLELVNPDVYYMDRKVNRNSQIKDSFAINETWMLKQITLNFPNLKLLHLEINRPGSLRLGVNQDALTLEKVVLFCVKRLKSLEDLIISSYVFKGNFEKVFKILNRNSSSVRYFTLIRKSRWSTIETATLKRAMTMGLPKIKQLRLNYFSPTFEIPPNKIPDDLKLKLFDSIEELLKDVKRTSNRTFL